MIVAINAQGGGITWLHATLRVSGSPVTIFPLGCVFLRGTDEISAVVVTLAGEEIELTESYDDLIRALYRGSPPPAGVLT